MVGSLIADRRAHEHHFTVYRCGGPPEIERWLANHGVSVASRSLPPGGPAPFIEIKADETVVGIIGIEAVEGLIQPPIVRPNQRNDISEGYRILFEMLEKTVVSGMNRRELLAVSREIEDRAFRVGSGTLRVSFQTLSNLKSQLDVYRALATETDLEIHIYGVDDWTPPEIETITYHAGKPGQFEPYWAMAYDGGQNGSQACGLVAEELADGYAGFWTSDSAIVEEIIAKLTRI